MAASPAAFPRGNGFHEALEARSLLSPGRSLGRTLLSLPFADPRGRGIRKPGEGTRDSPLSAGSKAAADAVPRRECHGERGNGVRKVPRPAFPAFPEAVFPGKGPRKPWNAAPGAGNEDLLEKAAYRFASHTLLLLCKTHLPLSATFER